MNIRMPTCTLLALSALLAACSGGGSDSGAQPASVSSAGAATPMYGQPLLFTINGSRLANAIDLHSAGCRDITLRTTAPNLSSANVAYYHGTVTAVGTQQALAHQGRAAAAALTTRCTKCSLATAWWLSTKG